MSKHRFPHFTGEETKLSKTCFMVQGLVKSKNYEAQHTGPSHPCVVVTPVGWGWQFEVTKGRVRYVVV